MRKDDDAKNAQLQLEVAARKADVAAIVEALKMAWSDDMTWQDELTSQDISRIFDVLETFVDNVEIVRWSVCALQAIVAEEVKDDTSRQYSVQSVLRVGPLKIYDNDLGERILHKKLVTEVAEFEDVARKVIVRTASVGSVALKDELVSFGRIRPDKLAESRKQKGIWLVPYEIQVPSGKDAAYQLRDHIIALMSDEEHLKKVGQDRELVEAMFPDDAEKARITKELAKKKGKKDKKKEENATEAEEVEEVPVQPVMRKGRNGLEEPDPRTTVVDDPCTFKVAKGIDRVLVAMQTHPDNVDVQHCAVYLLRWVVAWGDHDVARVMVQADALDEIEGAMRSHEGHRSLQNHGKFASDSLTCVAHVTPFRLTHAPSRLRLVR